MSGDRNPEDRRLAVFSDTHGNRRVMPDVLGRLGPFDGLIHLGDGVADGREAARVLKLEFIGVSGNEDYGGRCPETRVLTIAGWTCLLMHGHQTEINPYQPPEVFDGYLAEMSAWTRAEGAGVLLFGHTHRAMLEKMDGIILINPGEQHLGSSQPPTFAVLDFRPDRLDVEILCRHQDGRFETRLRSRWRAGTERWPLTPMLFT
ncbi:MAG: YfcE family phosphodiesterase [Proteobacteria bacterium]|nr:YfcE family phosphodiesterase [Pseudomonadota bacterium]